MQDAEAVALNAQFTAAMRSLDAKFEQRNREPARWTRAAGRWAVGGRRRGVRWPAGGLGRREGGLRRSHALRRLRTVAGERADSVPPTVRSREGKQAEPPCAVPAPPGVPALCRRDAMEYTLLMPSSPAGLTMRGVPYSVSI